MAELITLKPAVAGVKVRKPDGAHLKEAGEKVELTTFWIRRLAAGEVIEVKAAKSAPKGEK